MKISRYTTLICLLSGAMHAAPVDLDGNGLADAWELRFEAEGLVAGGDEDGDSLTNLEECLAGTNPFSPTSFFKVEGVERMDEWVELDWATIEGKEYMLQVNTGLGAAGWRNEGLWRRGEGTPIELRLAMDRIQLMPGTMRREFYNLEGFSGGGMTRLLSAIAAGPSEEITDLASLRYGEFVPDRDAHGSRIRGFLIPPASGAYQFRVAGDDNCEVFLSAGTEPADKELIASIPVWTRQNEWDKYEEQLSMPIELVKDRIYYFEALQNEFGGGDHLEVQWRLGDDPFQTIPATVFSPFAEDNEALFEEGDQHFFRVLVRDLDSDGDEVSDYEELTIGYDPLNASSNGGGLNDRLALEAALGSPNRVSIEARRAIAYETGGGSGEVVIRRLGGLGRVRVPLSVLGNASGIDFQSLPGEVEFGIGQRELSLPVIAHADDELENDELIRVMVGTGSNYSVEGTGEAVVHLEDSPAELFTSPLSPLPGVVSIGSGIVEWWQAGNSSRADVRFSVSGLTSDVTSAQFLLTPSGGGIEELLTTLSSAPGEQLELDLTALAYQPAEIRAALDDGRLRLVVSTLNFPDGEISSFIRAAESEVFSAPASPSLAAPPLSESEAARFLNQASFGADDSSLAAVMAAGYEGWIDQQMATPPTLHRPPLEALEAQEISVGQSQRMEEWFRIAIESDDQLRQRMAFALSEILVISDENGDLRGRPIAMAHYYDMLLNGAFGNYRDLLEDVTKSPLMGLYLSHIRNPKADPDLGIEPDENYAREVMQLFSIGLVALNADGSVKLGSDGVPAPTYDQTTITETAKVFTGWSYFSEDPANGNFRYGARDDFSPMSNYPDFHDEGPKTVVGGTIIPAGQTGEEDLDMLLDLLFNHPNTGPFLSRLLIQRFTTSNPSPGYIYRVAQAFENDGTGARGNLGAVVKAILLDPEARNASYRSLPGYGKVKEPLIRMTEILRGFGTTPVTGTYRLRNEDRTLGQAPLRSPTVFNFFLPDYSLPGEPANAGLLTPELQILTETTIISASNRFIDLTDRSGVNRNDDRIILDYPALTARLADETIGAGNPPDVTDGMIAFVDRLDLLLCQGTMRPLLRSEIYAVMLNVNRSDVQDERERRVEAAFALLMTSPSAAYLK